jgi:NADPH:quinone reductase-like Zn-dependent oxidoreductase
MQIGRITLIGFLNGMEIKVPLVLKGIVVQGISVGHRRAFEEMNRAVDQYGIKPVIDRTYALVTCRRHSII